MGEEEEEGGPANAFSNKRPESRDWRIELAFKLKGNFKLYE